MKTSDAFLEEITNNFSELLVESFFIRYFHDCKEQNLLTSIHKLQYLINLKIKFNFSEKLLNYGYSQKELDDNLI